MGMIKVYDNVYQRTEEWYKLKWGKIGGSISGGLFINSDTLLMDILAEVVEDFQLNDTFQNSAMLRGQELEPHARVELELYTGVKFYDVGWIENEKRRIIGISPDGLSDDYTIACELKCLQAKMHNDVILNGVVHKDHVGQCIHYFTVNPLLKTLYYCCYRPENNYKPLFVIKVERDTPIDIGRTVKGKIKEDRGFGEKEYVCTNADIRTVDEWVKVAEESIDILQERINETIKTLNF